MLGLGLLLLLLPCSSLSSHGASVVDTQSTTDEAQCNKTCSNNSACNRYVFLMETCYLLNCSNCATVAMEDLLPEEFTKNVHATDGATASGLPDPVSLPESPPVLLPNNSSPEITMDSESPSLNIADQAPALSSSRQTSATSPESERVGGSLPAGGAVPRLDSLASPQPIAPIPVQQQNPANISSTANPSLETLTPPPAPATSMHPTTTPAGPVVTSTSSTPSPAAAITNTTTATTIPATTTSTTMPATSPATTTVATSTIPIPKAKASTTTTPTPTTTASATSPPKANGSVTTTPTPTTSTTPIPKAKESVTTTPTTTTTKTTVAIQTTTTASTEAPIGKKEKPSTSALPERLSPTTNARDPEAPLASTTEGRAKMADAVATGGSIIEVAGAPLAKQLIDTASLWAVLLFGLLFFLVTVVLFMTQAYESYRRKDYTQVDYLINGMYTDSGV